MVQDVWLLLLSNFYIESNNKNENRNSLRDQGVAAFCIIGKSSELSYDTKTLRGDAQGLPQRSEGTQTQRKMSLESDAFAAQNPAQQDSYSFKDRNYQFFRVQYMLMRSNHISTGFCSIS